MTDIFICLYLILQTLDNQKNQSKPTKADKGNVDIFIILLYTKGEQDLIIGLNEFSHYTGYQV